jgi:transposase
MKKSSREREWQERPARTIGIDLGDRFSRYCVLNSEGEVIEEGRVRTQEEALRQHWEGEPSLRMVMETGTHSPWVSRLLSQLGHQVIVANARKVRAITENESKSDRRDAEMLARLGYCNPRLVAPIQHRSVERQRDLNLIRARDTLVRARTMLINSARGLVKSGRWPPALLCR